MVDKVAVIVAEAEELLNMNIGPILPHWLPISDCLNLAILHP